MAFNNKFISLLFLVLCPGTVFSQVKTFILDSAFAPMKFKITEYYMEGREKEKKKPKKAATITLTVDSIKVDGRSVMFEDRPAGYNRSYLSKGMKRADMIG